MRIERWVAGDRAGPTGGEVAHPHGFITCRLIRIGNRNGASCDPFMIP